MGWIWLLELLISNMRFNILKRCRIVYLVPDSIFKYSHVLSLLEKVLLHHVIQIVLKLLFFYLRRVHPYFLLNLLEVLQLLLLLLLVEPLHVLVPNQVLVVSHISLY